MAENQHVISKAKEECRIKVGNSDPIAQFSRKTVKMWVDKVSKHIKPVPSMVSRIHFLEQVFKSLYSGQN